MKQRILSGVVLLALLVLMLVLMQTPVFVALIALLASIAVYEIEKVAQVRNLAIRVVSIGFTALVPFWFAYSIRSGAPVSAFVPAGIFALLLLLFMLARYDTTRFEHVATAFMASLTVPCAFSAIIGLRDLSLLYPDVYSTNDGVYFFLFGLVCSWVTDIGAYFVGRFLGKHKLSPKISPKKTVEGAIGGVAVAAVVNVLVLLVFNKFFFEHGSIISYWAVVLTSIPLSVFSMFGDLSASAVKRNYGVKDFGNLIPGHGGIMDRFDSCLFVFPALFIVITIIQTI